MKLESKKIKVLFVCLGNICRSPMAEGAFLHLIEKAKLQDRFEVDSAGTAAYHIGKLADERMRKISANHGILLKSRARKITKEDLDYYDYILAMDKENHKNIQKLSVCPLTNLYLMREFDDQVPGDEVPDPYYGGLDGFEEVYEMQLRTNKKMLFTICRRFGFLKGN